MHALKRPHSSLLLQIDSPTFLSRPDADGRPPESAFKEAAAVRVGPEATAGLASCPVSRLALIGKQSLIAIQVQGSLMRHGHT